MKRGKKLLLLTLVLVVVAGAALAALKFMPDEEVEETESISVLTLDAESITGLAWSYGDESLSFVCDGSVWSYSEDADFPLDTSYMSAMTSAVSDISAEKVIEEASDLAEYGLDEPVCSITVTAEAETTIDIGDETSLDGLRYVSIGDGNVYLVSSDLLTNFSYGLYDLVAKETLPGMSELVSFSVERASGTLVIDYLEGSDLAYTDRYTYFAEDGDGWLSLDSELAENFVSQITGLTWGDCVDYKADLKTLGNYGLDSPAVTVTVNYIEPRRSRRTRPTRMASPSPRRARRKRASRSSSATTPRTASTRASRARRWCISSTPPSATACSTPRSPSCCPTT